MSQSHSRHEESTALTTDADLTAVVSELVERVESLEQTVDEQAEQIESLEQELKEERETRARADAEQRQRLHDAEDRLEDLEEGDITDETPTHDAGEDASTEPLTPIERLSESGDSTDIATNVTASVRRAVTLFENLSSWGQKTPKGIVLKPADRPLQLLEAATEESLAWQQYYRAAEALERLSKGAVTFFDHQKHGKTLVLHEGSAVYDRATQSKTGRQQSSLAAD